jgi:AsmA protein
MKPVLKILFWLIGVVFTLIIIAAIVLPLLVDPNDFRDDIGQAVKKQTGRELIIEGDLSLSVVPWLGVKVGRASLSNAPGLGDEPMLAIEGASVGVRLMPLLSRRLEVSEITLDGARINLYRGASGSNWDDLTGAQEATAEPTPATDSPAFGMSEIGGIRLRDARVRFVDDVEGARLEAGLGEFATGRIYGDGEAYAIDGAMVTDAAVDYEDREVGTVKASIGALVVDEISADPETPVLGGVRLQKVSAQLSGGKAGSFRGSLGSLTLDRATGPEAAPQVEGLLIEEADVDYDDGKGTLLVASLKILSAARLEGDPDKPVLESVAVETATFDYKGGKSGSAKGSVGQFSVDRLVGDAEAPLLDKLLLAAADVNYEDEAGARYTLKAERVDAASLRAGPGAPVLGKTDARQVRVVSAGEGGFELELGELVTGGMVADPDALEVEGLTLKKARFAMDQGEGGPAEARIDELTLGTLKPGTATPLTGKIDGSYGKPVVNFTTTLDGQASIAKDGTIGLTGFRADLGFEGENVPGGKQSGRIAMDGFSVNTKTQAMTLDGFTADLADLSLKASARGQKVVDAPDIQGSLDTGEFSPRRILETLGMPAPVTTDPEAMTLASLTGSFRISKDRVTLSGLKARLDDTSMSGEFSAVEGEPAVVRANLKVDQIDVDRYLPPEGEIAAAETEGAGEIDTSDLKKLDAEAALDIGRLKVSGLTLTGVNGKAVVKNGRLVVEPLGAALYGGKVSGRFTLDGTGEVPRLEFKQSLDGVQAGSLLEDLAETNRLTGKAQFALNLDTAGRTSDEMLSALNGDMNFELVDGVIRGFNITHALQTAVALFDRKGPPKAASPDTIFEDFRGSAKVEKGVVRSDDLRAVLPNLNVTGAGSVNLATQVLDYRLKAEVPRGQAAVDAGLGKLAGKSVPVRISGNLNDPDVSADVSAIIASEVEGLILDKLGIGKKKGEEVPADSSGGQPDTGPEEQQAPQEEKQETTPEEDAVKALKKLLGG